MEYKAILFEVSGSLGDDAAPDAPTVVLPTQQTHRAWQNRQGWARVYQRQNQLLPYGRTSLTRGEVDRIADATRLVIASRVTDDVLIGALAVSVCMTTGRSPRRMFRIPLQLRALRGAAPPQEGLIIDNLGWGWWLRAGGPVSRQRLESAALSQVLPTGPLIWMPCSTLTRQLVLKYVKIRPYNASFTRVFQCSKVQLERGCQAFLRRINPRVRMSAIEAWLTEQLTRCPGGDSGAALAITDQRKPLGETTIHYTAVEVRTIPESVEWAIAPFDTVLPDPPIIRNSDYSFVGSRYCPTSETIRTLRKVLVQPLLSPGRGHARDIVAIHNSIVLYTVMMTLLSTGLRPSRKPLPVINQIDPFTGFTIIDDKATEDNFKSRLVWVTPDCIEQLRLLSDHLEILRNLRHERIYIPAEAFDMQSPSLIDCRGTAQKLTLNVLRSHLRQNGWQLPLNAGRHFLRSSLLGKVSPETMHAFLGHWHIGNEPWNSVSMFDPLAFRADLERSLVPLLRAFDWVPVHGLK